MQTKITHLTSAHPRNDTRIFIKECNSLAKKEDYIVNLIVADGKGNEIKNNVNVIDIGANVGGRISRMTTMVKKIFKKAKELDSDIYHLHDPELISIGLKLKKMGKKVIFDAHEDVPKQILAKHYLNSITKRILSFIYAKYEIYMLKKFDYVVSATPIIRNKFLRHGIKSLDINNYPILDELVDIEPNFTTNSICYIGLLYETRGIREVVKAIENIDIKLIIAGEFYDAEFEKEIKSLKGWEKVDFRGFVGREEIKKILSDSIAGLVTLHPTPSYMEAYPVKMFEYMSAGIAVISSNFPLYKKFVEKSECGICIDPLNIKKIEEAIRTLVNNISKVKHMGQNGKKAIKEKYNWTNEEQKLYKIYKEIGDY